MPENVRRLGGESWEDRPSDPFSLRRDLERQLDEFAAGPTMADILRIADEHRAGGMPRDLIAAGIRADREEHHE